jgi:type II secretory pathway pseudopilin PulG
MSYYGGGMMPGAGGGGSSQMMSMSMSLVLVCAAAAGAYVLMSRPKTTPQQQQLQQQQQQLQQQQQQAAAAAAPQQAMIAQNVVASAPGSVGRAMAGRYQITYGGLSLVVDPKDCQTKNAWFSDATGGTKHEWNLKLVPGFEDVYYISSQERAFDKGCDAAYLEAPSSCTGPASLNRPATTDLQYWRLVPSTDGGFELQNVSCANKRWPSFMISSGNQGGATNTARLASRTGSPYLFRKVA